MLHELKGGEAGVADKLFSKQEEKSCTRSE